MVLEWVQWCWQRSPEQNLPEAAAEGPLKALPPALSAHISLGNYQFCTAVYLSAFVLASVPVPRGAGGGKNEHPVTQGSFRETPG